MRSKQGENSMVDVVNIQTYIESSRKRVKELQRETVDCIVVNSKGKIEITNESKLADLHHQIDTAKTAIEHYTKVLAELETILRENEFQNVLQLRNGDLSTANMVRFHETELSTQKSSQIASSWSG